jgi:hypothetical protein
MTKKVKQEPLLGLQEPWKEHWQGMPEFVQEDMSPWKSIYVHFSSKEDMEDFSRLIGQKVTPRTKFIWHPKVGPENLLQKKCIDEP